MPPGDTALQFLTDFGDQAVVLPTFLAVAIILLLQRRLALAGMWVLAMGGVLGGVLVLKLADQSCGWTVPALAAWDLMNPSGHSSSGSALWGCGVGLLAAGRGWRTVAASVSSALAAALVIGVTRVALGAHTGSEAIAGGVVGVAGALAFGLMAGTAWAARRGGTMVRGRAALPVLGAVAVMAVTHGYHLEFQPDIHSFSVDTIRMAIPACQPPPGSHADAWVRGRGATPP